MVITQSQQKGLAPLAQPAADGEKIRKVLLKNWKFTPDNIHYCPNSNIDLMKEKMKEVEMMGKSAVANRTHHFIVIYYSGHGVTKNNEAYMISNDGVRVNFEEYIECLTQYLGSLRCLQSQYMIFFASKKGMEATPTNGELSFLAEVFSQGV